MQLPWAKHKKKQRSPRLMEGQESYTFRRSRTITGTSAPAVNASAPSRGQLKTNRIKLMELRAHRQQILKVLAGILGMVVVIIWLVSSFVFTPKISFAQKGVRQPVASDYAQSFYHYFDDHPLERFGFLLRQSDLEAQLVHEHPEVFGLTFSRNWFGGNAQFSVLLRKPLLAWQTSAKKFYVDAQGVAFTYNMFTEPTLTVTDQSGIPPDQSGVVASSRFIRFLGQIVGALNGYGKGTVTSVIIPAATREVDIKLTGRDYVIKTNTDRDPNQEAEDIANALSYYDKKGIRPQYIDARVAHKVFYK